MHTKFTPVQKNLKKVHVKRQQRSGIYECVQWARQPLTLWSMYICYIFKAKRKTFSTVFTYPSLGYVVRSDIDSNEISVDGYKIARQDRTQKNGGGCIIYYSNNLSCFERTDILSPLKLSGLT